MLTQIISGDIMAAKLDDIIMRSGESNRIIIFRLVDGKGEAITAEDYSMEFILQKPDGNFVIQTLGTITDGFYLHTIEQMAAVKGMGYYTLRISDTDDLIYTAHGAVIIDDNTLSDGDIESISLVNGLRFPDDFLTTDSNVAIIDDTGTSDDTTWSSNKISGEIAGSVSGLIDDNATDSDTTWSSDKITSELSALSAITISPVYNAVSLSYSDISISYGDYDALIIYVNDALTQCGVSNVFSKQYLDYCRTNNRTLTFYPFGSAYVSYNILTDKFVYAGDNNQGFTIIRIDGVNF